MGPPQKKPGDNDPSWDWVSKLVENAEIDISGDKFIGTEELKRVYRISTLFKICLFCTRNCKRNPFCLWGLGEKYWLKKTDEDQVDEEESDYRGEGEFIGLQNLGATCYVNSLLQLWFHNPILRPVILEWRPTHKIDANEYVPMCPIAQLQAMFARMAFSKKKSIKPGDFVNQLNLDTREQQDAQEFSKLFMGHIISLLNTPENQKIKSMISEAFDGEFEHETKCLNCSKVNPRRETFNELEINVCSTLGLAIAEFLKIELLNDDNQYYCTNCQSLQNAERCTKLISLPPVLNFQIKRFMYDREIMKKKKIHTEIEFPETLNMDEFSNHKHPHNGKSSQLGNIYKLTAVLIHNGQRATEGHYTSHIKDLKTGKWYKFNDESVDKVDGNKLIIKSNKEKDKSSTEGKVNGKSNGHKSDGAYMLVYTKENLAVSIEDKLPEYLEKLVNREDAEYEKELTEAKSKKEIEAKVIAEKSQNIEAIYKLLIEKREELKNSVKSSVNTNSKYQNSSHTDSSDDVDEENRLQENEKEVARNKSKSNPQNEVNGCSQRRRNNSEKSANSSQINRNKTNNKIASELEVDTSDLSQFDFVSLSWLSSFLNPKEDVFEIDNSDILCVHDKLNPPSGVVSKYKVISSEIIDIFFEKTFEKNRLRGEDALCKDCVVAKFDNISGLIKLDKDCKLFSELFKVSDNAEVKVWITKDSFKSWKKYAKVALYGPNDEHEICEFNSGIQCEHGQLDPDQTNRKLISFECWTILHKYFDTPPYLENDPPCSICANMTVKNTELAKQNKDVATQQKTILNELYLNKNRPRLEKEGTYYVISTSFLDNWRNFIRDPLKKEPDVMIENKNLLCLKHKKFMYHQSFLQNLSFEEENSELFEKIFSFLTEFEWKNLTEKFAYDNLIKVVVSGPESKDGISYEPEACIGCGTEWWIDYTNRRYQFENKVIYIQKRTPEEAIQENTIKEDSDSYTIPAKREKRDFYGDGRVQDPSPSSSSFQVQGSTRRSSRPRRQRGEKNYNVSSCMTVMDLKKKLCADFKVLASDQHLFYKDKELKDPQATLEQCQIRPNTILYLEVDTTNGVDNYEDESMDASPETGFSGTLLCQQQNIVNNGTL